MYSVVYVTHIWLGMFSERTEFFGRCGRCGIFSDLSKKCYSVCEVRMKIRNCSYKLDFDLKGNPQEMKIVFKCSHFQYKAWHEWEFENQEMSAHILSVLWKRLSNYRQLSSGSLFFERKNKFFQQRSWRLVAWEVCFKVPRDLYQWSTNALLHESLFYAGCYIYGASLFHYSVEHAEVSLKKALYYRGTLNEYIQTYFFEIMACIEIFY